jgi:hypothetical protein
MSYVLGADAARSITPVLDRSQVLLAVPENVPPVVPVTVRVVVPELQNVPPLTVAVG